MCGRSATHFALTRFNPDWLPYFDEVAENAEEVTLMGWGEPTLHPQFAQFLDWANQHSLRKYFCTNGMRLETIAPLILGKGVDVMAISLDGASPEVNNSIRRGSDFHRIIRGISKVVELKRQQGTSARWPYMNFVITLMRKNLHELPKLVRLAAELGLEEVKAVYLTAFDEAASGQVLCGSEAQSAVKQVFAEAEELASNLGVALKLPHLQGDDPAGNALHKPCFTGWRDFFLGSDGFVRPCMSTAEKLFSVQKYASFTEAWNSPEMQKHRSIVNDTSAMPRNCKACYQSSFANWNRQESFLQAGEHFAPKWGGEK
jgi:MoaA/NifB/PqqE/SkfB family radical SAM enzyme